MKLSSNIGFALRLELLDRGDAGGTRRPVVQLVRLALGRLRDEPQDVEHTGAEDDEVDDDEGDQRGADGFGIDIGQAVRRSEQAVDGVGLSPDLGGVPACEYG